MPRIFISYRRGDSPGYAGRLFDRIQSVFGPENVFIDVDTLRPGDDFVEAINSRLQNCDIVLAVIGPRWRGEDGATSRLHEEADFVRIEIESALERKIRVVPVLVQGATIPRKDDLPASLYGLLRRHAIELSDTRWAYDVTRLIEGISDAPQPPGVSATTHAPRPEPRSQPTPPVANVTPALDDRVAAARPIPPVQPGLKPRKTRPSEPRTRSAGVRAVQIDQELVVDIGYDTWISESLRVSADFRRFAFVRRKQRFLGLSEKFAVVLDGEEGAEWDALPIASLHFDQSGRRFGFMAKSEQKWSFVADGKRQRLYDNVAVQPGSFSPDGRRIAYGATVGNRWTVVVDDRHVGSYDGILEGTPLFSPDGDRVAYGALIGNQWTVVVDDEEMGRYEAISKGTPVFSPDGQRIAYGAQAGGKWTIVADGVESGEYKNILIPVFSPQSQRFAYGAHDGDSWIVVVDDEVVGRYDGILVASPVFSADGARITFGATAKKKWTVVVDGQAGSLYDGLMEGTPLFSPNGQHVAYGARIGGKWMVVVDDRPGNRYDGIMSGTPVFSPDSRRVAYGARTGNKWMTVVDDKECAGYDSLFDPPTFSPDGALVAYTARKADTTLLVVDGHECVLPGPTLRGSRIAFDDNKTIRALVVAGSQVYRIHATIK